MDTSLPAALGVGFVLGVRHAMDADHVAALSTLVTRHRSLTRSCLLGAFWGAGHTAALLAAGVAVMVFKLTITPEWEQRFEMAVAAVLALLGGHVLLRALRGFTLHRHEHSHDGQAHHHLHLHLGDVEPPGHVHVFQFGARPFLVGLVHGMAGSAALMLLVVAASPSLLAGVLYILVFGIGSTVGMLVLSGLIGIPFAATSGRAPRLHAAVQVVAGLASVTLGLALIWDLGGS
ncbi:MAG: urease accessory protein UreH [Candidatus Rokuibacteriota bacterium]